MNIEEIINRIRVEVPKKILEEKRFAHGISLNKAMISFIEVKSFLYACLKDIEIDEINKKWNQR